MLNHIIVHMCLCLCVRAHESVCNWHMLQCPDKWWYKKSNSTDFNISEGNSLESLSGIRIYSFRLTSFTLLKIVSCDKSYKAELYCAIILHKLQIFRWNFDSKIWIMNIISIFLWNRLLTKWELTLGIPIIHSLTFR